MSLRVLEHCAPAYYRWLYTEVGRAHLWVDRLGWSDGAVRRHLAAADVSLWLLLVDRRPAGFFELVRRGPEVEIGLLGLRPAFVGRGLGRGLLTAAAENAWSGAPDPVRRVWLHTCDLDAPQALPNYLARGFRVYRVCECSTGA